MNNVLIISNFEAGRRKAVKYKKLVLDFILKYTQSFKCIGLDDIKTIDIYQYDTLFVLGGDGTINKLLPYIVNSDIKLAIIPCGTANLLAAKLGLSANIGKTLKIIEKGAIKKIDIININSRLCALRTGFGYDSDIICKTPQSLKNRFGYFAYFIAGIIFAMRLKFRECELVMDGKPYKTMASCLILANAANMYRNLVSVARDSRTDDGLMDIFVLKTTNPVSFFFEFCKIILNIRNNSIYAEYMQAKNVNIKNSWIPCHIDGEKVNLKDNIQISLCNNCVNVYCR